MIKENIKYGTFFFKIYSYYHLYIKEKFYIERSTYSQSGEDIFIKKFFKNKKKGSYVDIGAFHPIRHSNTQLLYNIGWNGINIDLNPASIDFFNIVRKRDKNIHAAISSKNYKTKVYLNSFFDTTNSIVKKKFDEWNANSSEKKFFYIETKTFNQIINNPFDFLNIDIEGSDLEVIQSINLNDYNPSLICIEILDNQEEKEFFKYFKDFKYNLIDKIGKSFFFKK